MVKSDRQGIGVAVFVKTPGLSPLKTRLAQGIGVIQAEQFHQKSVHIMEKLLLQWGKQRSFLHFYWAVAESEALELEFWRSFPRIYQGEGGLGQRLHRVFAELWSRHEQIIFLGADSPHVTLDYLELALPQSVVSINKDTPFYIGLTADGGFYLLSARQNIPESIWTQVKYSVKSTGEDLINRLKEEGAVQVGAALYDIDQVEDLYRLSQENSSLAIWAPEQRQLILWSRQFF